MWWSSAFLETIWHDCIVSCLLLFRYGLQSDELSSTFELRFHCYCLHPLLCLWRKTDNIQPMWLPKLSFPICRSFVPTSLDGQRCYKLQVNKTTEGSKNREGLLLVVDINEDMRILFESQNKQVGNINAFFLKSYDPSNCKLSQNPYQHIAFLWVTWLWKLQDDIRKKADRKKGISFHVKCCQEMQFGRL